MAAVLAVSAGLLRLIEALSPGGTSFVGPGVDRPTLVWAASAFLLATSVTVPVVGGWLALRAPDAALAVLGVSAVTALPSAYWMLRTVLGGPASVGHAVVVAVLLAGSVALLLRAGDRER